MSTNLDLEVQRQRLGSRGRTLLGVFLFAQMVIQAYFLLQCWPVAVTPADPGSPARTLLGIRVDREVALILSVAILGAMGGSTHALSSFALFVGNRSLVRSWTWWYILRAPIGLSLAVVLYFVVRGGLLVGNMNSSGGADAFNPHGIGALAALAGLCSEAATRKLAEVFETLFRSDKKPDKDPVNPLPLPKLVSVEPAIIAAGSGATTVTLTGDCFAHDDLVIVDGTHVPHQPVSATQARVTLDAALLATAGEHELLVRRAANPDLQSSAAKVRVA